MMKRVLPFRSPGSMLPTRRLPWGSRRVALAATLLMLGVGSKAAGAYERPGHTERVSVSSDGTEGALVLTVSSWPPTSSISFDGRHVAFASPLNSLVFGDLDNGFDIFVRDRKAKTTERVSVDSHGLSPQGVCEAGAQMGSAYPTISATGRYVAFLSCAANLVPGDTNNQADVFVHDRKTGKTERVSVSSDGTEGNGFASDERPSITSDGRFVAFGSSASNLTSSDDDSTPDIFVRDRRTRVTSLVSVSSDGAKGEGNNVCPSLTTDGRYVVFSSDAPNLIAPDTNLSMDVFMHDRKTQQTQRISVTSDGSEAASGGSNTCDGGGISANGKAVAFVSAAVNLIPSKRAKLSSPPQQGDVFVYDVNSARVERVSVTSFGEEAKHNSFHPAISPDGRYVAFSSDSNDLHPGDSGGSDLRGDTDAYVFDRRTGGLEWISVAPDGSEARRPDGRATAFLPSISAGGRFVSFADTSGNIVAGDNNLYWDIFVRDLGLGLGTGGFSQAEPSGGLPPITGHGRLAATGFSFSSDPTGDSEDRYSRASDLIAARIAYRPHYEDLFVALEVENMGELPHTGLLYGLHLDADGTTYEVRAAQVASDALSSGYGTFSLFTCERTDRRSCTEVDELRGGFGTTGEAVVFTIPLAAVGLADGGRLTGLRAYSAHGSLLTGALRTLDEAAL